MDHGPGKRDPGAGGRPSLPGATIIEVRDGSIGQELGLGPGDRILAVGGAPLEDYIDYRFLTSEPSVELSVVRPDGEAVVFEIEKDPDEDLGLVFSEDVFGGPERVKRCGNRCRFCFVDRLPPGLRAALYVKDDDYRLSFLHGNFITLTNLGRADLERIAKLRLSPLYVSVHATDPQLRAALMGTPRAAAIMEQLTWLAEAGITIHTQVVVCPGLNDGRQLDRTMGDLFSLHPAVASVGVVPVGLTRFGPGPKAGGVRALTDRESAELLESVLCWHKRLGGFAYPADELFLRAGRTVPRAAFYDGYPQLQNGIGLVRVFLDDLARLERRVAAEAGQSRAAAARAGEGAGFVVVTGALAAPLLERALPAVSRAVGVPGRVVVVDNGFFGPGVTVSGLLAGRDVLAAVRRPGADGSGPIVVPGAALRAGSDEFVDGVTCRDIARETGRPCLDGGWLPSHLVAGLEAAVHGRIMQGGN